MYLSGYFLKRLLFWLLFPFIKPGKEHFILLEGTAQGTTYEVKYHASDSLVTSFQVDSILLCIDQSLSLYRPGSLINRFNQSDSGILMDDHFKNVIELSFQTYKQTSGAFEITVKPLIDAWGFGSQSVNKVPNLDTVMNCIGTDLLKMKGSFLVKEKPCVQIDCNGIAQGYSVDVIADFLEARGIQDYLVELGGEIRAKGRNMLNEPWKIGIEPPPEFEVGSYQSKIIVLETGAVTTSGTFRNFRVINGVKYPHVMDPKTGYPVNTGIISVTVMAKKAAVADGLDNALMVMGLSNSFAYLKEHPGVEAYFFYRSPDGQIKDTCSKGFRNFFSSE